MSRSRRPSVSIYDYPEDLNPFKDETTTATTTTTRNISRTNGEMNNTTKEPKHKFWTFGRSKKKQRSNSFSIKSKWSGLFGKRNGESKEVELRKPTIPTVSTTYKRETYNGCPVAPVRESTDQQEFNQALGTLVRRRKYTLDDSSRYGSSMTVNGDPGRIYEGSPRETTASIMGDLTPRAPARRGKPIERQNTVHRFGQVSPKPTDVIPPLESSDYRERASREESDPLDQTPIPPKRSGNGAEGSTPRASRRSIVYDMRREALRSGERLMDENDNENLPDEYVFKRFNRDNIRRSNLSINSCVSVGSTVSGYGRKKRRAPQPPVSGIEKSAEIPVARPRRDDNLELKIVEPTDIARVTEDIVKMTETSRETDDGSLSRASPPPLRTDDDDVVSASPPTLRTEDDIVASEERLDDSRQETNVDGTVAACEETTNSPTISSPVEKDQDVKDEEGENVPETETIETIERVETPPLSPVPEELPVLTRRESRTNLSRSDSFSVKDEIEKIERQIKLLESRGLEGEEDDEVVAARTRRTSESEEEPDESYDRRGSRAKALAALRESRQQFFRKNVDTDDEVKVELRQLPREQRDTKIVRLVEDSSVSVEVEVKPEEAWRRVPVKVVQLHISEPIKPKPSLILGYGDVNPIPKPRRHSNLGLESRRSVESTKIPTNRDSEESRANSL